MDYFGRNKQELTDLLQLIRSERADYERLAKAERAALDMLVGDRLSAGQEVLTRERRQREAQLAKERATSASQLQAGQDELAVDRRLFDREQNRARKEFAEEVRRFADDKAAFHSLVQEKTKGFPWLATAFSDYERLRDLQLAEGLQKKSHPALVAADKVREQSLLRRAAQKEARVYRYLLEYYETLFPWLVEFKGDDLDELLEMSAQASTRDGSGSEPADPVQKWLTPSEYSSLPSDVRNQLALDRWRQKPKNRWEVGRDYERYVGYLYERDGYAVSYQGIVRGFEDLGRDLICSNGKMTAIVQCKHWSQDKLIHEKHIFQLYGTVVAYRIEVPNMPAMGVFYTTTSLSSRARQFAAELDIDVAEQRPPQPYPCIKCNVSRLDASKIYHLPFDQQYDRTVIEHDRNECYVETVAEAEHIGFRRAFRWHGKDNA